MTPRGRHNRPPIDSGEGRALRAEEHCICSWRRPGAARIAPGTEAQLNTTQQQPLAHQRGTLQFKAVRVQPLDAGGRPIPHREGGGDVVASGFVRREAGGLFLYTCWHVVSGLDRNTRSLPPTWIRPATLRVESQLARPVAEGTEVVGGSQEILIALYSPDGTPRWAQDRQHIPNSDLNGVGLRFPFWHDAVKLPLAEVYVSALQVVDAGPLLTSHLLVPGDKVLIVGYPYGYSALGPDQPTPIVMTRFVAAMRTNKRRHELVLDGAGAPGMSGSPVFLEHDSQLYPVGLYTGVLFPEPSARFATALGTFADMLGCWSHEALALVFSDVAPEAVDDPDALDT